MKEDKIMYMIIFMTMAVLGIVWAGEKTYVDHAKYEVINMINFYFQQPYHKTMFQPWDFIIPYQKQTNKDISGNMIRIGLNVLVKEGYLLRMDHNWYARTILWHSLF